MTLPTPIGFTNTYTIRTYEIDNQKVCLVPSLIKLMHEAAMENVLKLKLSVWDLEPHHISWVLMRKSLKINRLPVLGDVIHVQTYPAGFEKFFTYRDYNIFDESGDLLASSSSTWLLMDTIDRKMTRIPEFILDLNKQMPPKEACLPRAKNKLIRFEETHSAKNFQVGWYDLDFNNHLNNVFYICWMLEALDDSVLQYKKLKDFDIVYKQEAKWKDQVISEVQRVEENVFLHRLVRAADGKELSLAQSFWE